MRLFYRYLLALGILLLVTSILIPIRYDVAYPKTLGPKLNNRMHTKYQNDIVNAGAELALVGDSILVTGVNPEELARLTGKRTVSLGIPGSASAVWYLMLKNNIIKVSQKPEYVLVFFRDTILTAPGYRVNGKYFSLVDDVANTDDRVLVQKAFIDLMNPLEQWADRYLPLYGSRLRLRETIDYYVRYSAASMAGCNQQCNDDANIAVFRDLNLDANLLVEAIATAESYLYTPNQLNFARQVDASFLPDMVDLARNNGIQLILVRTKHQNYPTEASEPAPLKQYILELKDYARQNDVIVLDFAHDDRLTPAMFTDSHHLNEQGAALFTQMLSEALQPVLQK